MHKSKHVRSEKFDVWAMLGMLVGFCKGEACRILISGTHKITETKDATIDESASGTTFDRGNYI